MMVIIHRGSLGVLPAPSMTRMLSVTYILSVNFVSNLDFSFSVNLDRQDDIKFVGHLFT